MKAKIFILFLQLFSLSIQQLSAQFASSSVLADGEVYKIGIINSGMYRISGQFLRSRGVNLGAVNPRHIRLFGNGGGMLPQANEDARIDDLKENPIRVTGEEDGQLNDNDFIIFYAEGPDQWAYNASKNAFEHSKNVYADTNYYFLKLDNRPGLRVQDQPNLDGSGPLINTFDEYQFYELDEKNILNSGREWYGERFENRDEYSYDFNTTGILPSSTIRLQTAVMARDGRVTGYNFTVNGNLIGQNNIPAVPLGTYDPKGAEVTNVFTFNSALFSNANSLRINVKFDKRGGTGFGYMNYLALNFTKGLRLYGNQTAFRSMASSGQIHSRFVVSDAPAGIAIWDITQPLAPVNQRFQLNGTEAAFGAGTLQLKQFIAFNENNLPEPFSFRKANSQNLHSLATVNLVIISPSQFLNEAQRLAEFRRSNDGLSVLTVTTEQIYNEFSSGRQDLTAIRDFMRMLYTRNPSTLKYLLLFGDGSYDYKNRIKNNSNFVPVYESLQSLHPIFSYSSDDYYGFLDLTEGRWLENSSGDHTLDIGIGRLPVKNIEEARQAVDKLIRYATNPASFGDWRNKITFVADDGDGNLHQRDAEILAEMVDEKHPAYNSEKLYMDTFEQLSLANGERSPKLVDAINRSVEEGSLILNFTGHGGESGWTEEQILLIDQIRKWKNTNNFPLFVTATCEFGRYDNPDVVSGAEEVFLKPDGGGIGLITTTRPVFASTNLLLNRAFYESVFKPVDGLMPCLGDVMRITKNNSLNGPINRNFALLGDPSMRLAYPKYNVTVTKINGKTLAQADTLKALGIVLVEGEVQDNLQNRVQNFNGQVTVNVYDKIQVALTKGTAASPMQYNVRNILLFKGKASVKEGRFTCSFIIPKNIQYKFGKGKIDFYAKADDLNLDGNGAADQIVVGGSAQNVAGDLKPPTIELFLNDETFAEGSTISRNAILLAKLSDESGINISSAGIGQDITFVLNKKEEEAVVLNEFYRADKDTYQKGTVRYALKDLPLGKNTLRLKAWDTYNNSAEKEISFTVSGEEDVLIRNVWNYPNPLSEKTKFVIEHNQAGKPLELQIEIYSSSGERIQILNHLAESPSNRYEVEWDGLNQFGQRINQGLYFYRLTLRSIENNARGYAIRKMIVVN